jgi:hypothetical protein
MTVYGGFTYRDLLSMESKERMMHYEALIEIKKEEKETTEKQSSASMPRMPTMPSIPKIR